MKSFRSLRALVVALPLASLALACGGSRDREVAAAAGGPAAPVRGGEAIVATITDLAGVNELISGRIGFTNDVLDQLFLQLLEEQADYAEHPPTFAPALAERYELSADRRTLTFFLRRDAVWSDGVPVTADDVRFTWQAQIDPGVAWAYADSKDAIADVEVVDPHTVRFHFSEVYPYQLVDVNDGKILPRHVWSQLPFAEWPGRADWFRDHLVVSGPFRLASWQPGQEIVLERNERAPADLQPRLDRVRFRVVPDQPAHVEQLLAGAVDFVGAVPPESAERVATSPEARLAVYPSRQYDYICWNTLREPFDDPAVRRALTLAIDRQGLVDALWHGYARVGFGPIPGGFWARHSTLAAWPYDPAEASRLLAAAGWKDHDGDGVLDRRGKPLRFELTTNSSNRLRNDALVIIQEQLRRIGVAAQPRALEIQALTERNIAHEFDATLSGWAVDTTLDLRPYFHSSEAAGGYNFGAYRNAELDALLESVRLEPDLERAKPVFERIQEILHREQPYTFLWEPQRLAGVRRDLRDVAPNALSPLFDLQRWWRAPRALGVAPPG